MIPTVSQNRASLPNPKGRGKKGWVGRRDRNDISSGKCLKAQLKGDYYIQKLSLAHLMRKCMRNYPLREDRRVRLDLHASACAHHQKVLSNQPGGAGSYPHSGRRKHISEFHVVSLHGAMETPSLLGFRRTLGMWSCMQCGQRPELKQISAPWLSSSYFTVWSLSDIYLRGERKALSTLCF